ncbi:DUF6600 domain-containing protein [Daejeonella sp. H1SJ63]|uniref:DUF6600 domain-containing protein n=1 Tax=Daejeonella sp. H1SJ63 TaxID=3034145 RepID=UPI0023ECCDC4|nr:DUF6600 domain-containing protein [Daejeonella sp. H1SJ63]
METKLKFRNYLPGLILILSLMLPGQSKAQYDDDVSLETFYEELSPYGVWINDPQYGYVWRPDVDQDEFRPYYTNGHWEMTQYGNTWVSNYDWGWAPFHYGRWVFHNRKGWLWIPDTRWGPAWVSWRRGGGYYGWAPLGPGVSISINIGPRIPDFYWVFVPDRSIYSYRYPRYDRYRNVNIYHNTVIINNTYVHNRYRYYTGPRVEEIRRVTNQPVKIHDVRDYRDNRYGRTNGRPEVDRRPEQRSYPSQNPRPERTYDNNENRGSVTGRGNNGIQNRPDTKELERPQQRSYPSQNTRPERTYDNNENRGSVTGRGNNGIQGRPDTKELERSGTNQPPASSQRSSRSWDNQEVRRSQEPVYERQNQGQSAPVRREERPARAQQSAPHQAPESSRQGNNSENRESSSKEQGNGNGRSQGRPSRVQ